MQEQSTVVVVGPRWTGRKRCVESWKENRESGPFAFDWLSVAMSLPWPRRRVSAPASLSSTEACKIDLFNVSARRNDAFSARLKQSSTAPFALFFDRQEEKKKHRRRLLGRPFSLSLSLSFSQPSSSTPPTSSPLFSLPPPSPRSPTSTTRTSAASTTARATR